MLIHALPYRLIQMKWGRHRGAWPAAVEAISTVCDNNGTVAFYDCIDWQLLNNKRKPTTQWTGILHCPQSMIEPWFASSHWQNIKGNCVGIFGMSNYTVSMLAKLAPGLLTDILYCPLAKAHHTWSLDKFKLSQQLVSVGTAHRDLNAIEAVSSPYKRYYLGTNKTTFLNNEDYDKVLSHNLVIIHLIESVMCNGILDCMATKTPVFTNRMATSLEYLGADYPLFYNNLDECANYLNDLGRIKAAHEYLCNLPTEHLTGEAMVRKLMASPVTKSITN